jgi:glucokinase
VFLAVDLGGTYARLALVVANDPGAPRLEHYARYRCTDYPGLAALLAHFLQSSQAPAGIAAVIASAGCIGADGSLLSANLPWTFAAGDVATTLGLEAVHLVNDFQALAHAVGSLPADAGQLLCGPAGDRPGPRLVLGPGTGLGAALWLPGAGGGSVLASEAGQAAWAAVSPLEQTLLAQCQQQLGRRHVALEYVLSGPGLLHLYQGLCSLHGQQPVHVAPDAITAAGLKGGDPLATQCLDVFCGVLGSASADLAMAYGASRVMLAGGVLPHLQPVLATGLFADRFLDKGVMRPVLEQVGVQLLEHGQLGVLGAARWYLGRSGTAA